ncbi:unnamed protein product [Wuchereria bancrofti]|uniref:Uncharacterized protein n=2 Tax=Wuchereria bancrofti TaxID=6293 RepID=A0A3P7EJQ5_WUCBA|nr:unnamed protein product [Wuchereria bancrofti]
MYIRKNHEIPVMLLLSKNIVLKCCQGDNCDGNICKRHKKWTNGKVLGKAKIRKNPKRLFATIFVLETKNISNDSPKNFRFDLKRWNDDIKQSMKYASVVEPINPTGNVEITTKDG